MTRLLGLTEGNDVLCRHIPAAKCDIAFDQLGTDGRSSFNELQGYVRVGWAMFRYWAVEPKRFHSKFEAPLDESLPLDHVVLPKQISGQVASLGRKRIGWQYLQDG